MILDNGSEERQVHRWITQYVATGQVDCVTGYFTVGALAFLAEKINAEVSKFRFVIGDIVSAEVEDERPLDLLNENVTAEGALSLAAAARQAVDFLRQDKVLVKTLEPNFCHAKTFIYRSGEAPRSFYLTGSSNLTEAGLGMKETHNVEMNIVGQGTEANFGELRDWFARLWEMPQASLKKTVDGRKVSFKQYLIDLISRLFVQYTPRDLYYKTLFELFGRPLVDFQNDPEVNRNLGRLENSEIYRALYEFQRKGVISLVKMIDTYGGAILADAVGLGKTWSALAVVKYYQSQGRDTILLCPKKLDHNWRQYLRRHGSRFEKDGFDYVIRYHTDLQDERLYANVDGLDRDFFRSPRPKLLVIDESHNLRNSKSGRYRFLVDNLLRETPDLKVLLLSATPINNSLIDVRNQFKLLVGDRQDGFRASLGINNLDALFRTANQAFAEWSEKPARTLAGFVKLLPKNFFVLTDALVVARTRRLIAGHTDHLVFPGKIPPRNIFLQGDIAGSYASFEDFINAFPKFFAAYRPAFYVEQAENVGVLEDEKQRDMFLTKMMQILLIKRLESSWKSFQSTLDVVIDHHQTALDRVKRYENGTAAADALRPLFASLAEEDDELTEDLTLGKREIRLADIAAAGNLAQFKDHLYKDLKALNALAAALALLERNLALEKGPRARIASRDEKLQHLMALIAEKQAKPDNCGNRKVLIFTAYTGTAEYLFDELTRRGFQRVATVNGQFSRTADSAERHTDFEPILQRFAPFTKLFGEKQWPEFQPSDPTLPAVDRYREWCEWIRDNDPRTAEKLNHPVDILIATDCLSEGQNLQDCDFVVNYDIHWNPVRAIQRLGRIDRLGSPNDRVYAVNFWPTREIDGYLKLQRRIEDRMAQMRLVGAEVSHDFTDRIKDILDDEHLQQTQEEQLLRQMQTTWDDIEQQAGGIGFDCLSLENFRQDLMGALATDEQRYAAMPNGVYTGFIADSATVPARPGLVALLGYPARQPGDARHGYQRHDLVFIDENGADLVNGPQEALELLARHKDRPRDVPAAIDNGDPAALAGWKDALCAWLAAQAGGDTDNGQPTAGPAVMDIVSQVQRGSLAGPAAPSDNRPVEDGYRPQNVDLILWFVVT